MTSALLIVVAAVALVMVHAIILGTLNSTPAGQLLSNLVQLALPSLAAVTAAFSGSGRELVQRARSLRPRVRVLYMSGDTEYAASQRPGLELDAPLLSKPFTSVTLSSKIREVLQHPAA